MAVTRFQRWVPEPLSSFVYVSEDMIWSKLHVQVKSAHGTRAEQFVLDSVDFDQGEFLSRCYETHIRLNREEKAVEDLLR